MYRWQLERPLLLPRELSVTPRGENDGRDSQVTLCRSTRARIRIRAPRTVFGVGTRHFSPRPTNGLLSHAFFIIYRPGIVARLASYRRATRTCYEKTAPVMKTAFRSRPPREASGRKVADLCGQFLTSRRNVARDSSLRIGVNREARVSSCYARFRLKSPRRGSSATFTESRVSRDASRFPRDTSSPRSLGDRRSRCGIKDS